MAKHDEDRKAFYNHVYFLNDVRDVPADWYREDPTYPIPIYDTRCRFVEKRFRWQINDAAAETWHTVLQDFTDPRPQKIFCTNKIPR